MSTSVSTRETKNDANGLRVAARRDEPLEPADVRLHHLLVPAQREDQRHVDVLARRDHVLDRAEAGLRRRDLHVEVRLVDPLVQALRLVVGRVAFVGDLRVDLPRDVAVIAFRSIEDGAQQCEPALHVFGGEPQEDLFEVVLLVEQRLKLLVVRVAGGERLLEDRRVGRDADDGVALHHVGELPVLEDVPREVVEPDALAVLSELLKPCLGHFLSPFLRSVSVF